MSDINDRQQKLLNAIISEFVDTAEAVGSINLVNRYNFKLSSATIRNEMAELVFRGYLYKKHSSAGRIPTNKAWKYFVDNVEGNINLIDADTQDQVISDLVKVKDEKIRLIRQSLNFLSMISENATVALIGNNLYYAGLSTLTEIPEMKNDDENLKRILGILEDYYALSDIFKKKKTTDEKINILIGEEDTGDKRFEGYSVIFGGLKFKDTNGFIAVVGPNRMKYDKVISAVKYMSDSIKFVVNN